MPTLDVIRRQREAARRAANRAQYQTPKDREEDFIPREAERAVQESRQDLPPSDPAYVPPPVQTATAPPPAPAPTPYTPPQATAPPYTPPPYVPPPYTPPAGTAAEAPPPAPSGATPPPGGGGGGGDGGGGGGAPAGPDYETPARERPGLQSLPIVGVSPTGSYISPTRGVLTEAQMRQELLAAGLPESAVRDSWHILNSWQAVANGGDKVTNVAPVGDVPESAYERSQSRPPAAGVAEQNPNLVGEDGTGGRGGGERVQRVLVGADGSVINTVMTDQEYAQAQADINQIQQDARAAQEFQQGIQQGQLDLARATQAAAAAYQQALIDGKNRELAQQEARDAMQLDLQQQQLQLQRMLAAANIRGQQEDRDLQRRRLRSSRLASVRYA